MYSFIYILTQSLEESFVAVPKSNGLAKEGVELPSSLEQHFCSQQCKYWRWRHNVTACHRRACSPTPKRGATLDSKSRRQGRRKTARKNCSWFDFFHLAVSIVGMFEQQPWRQPFDLDLDTAATKRKSIAGQEAAAAAAAGSTVLAGIDDGLGWLAGMAVAAYVTGYKCIYSSKSVQLKIIKAKRNAAC